MKRMIGLVLVFMLLGSFAAAQESLEDYFLPAGEVLEMDMDGDGAAERLSWFAIENDEYMTERVHIQVEFKVAHNEGTAVGWTSDELYGAQVYVCDVNSDGVTEIFLTGDEMSDDYVTFCLNYMNAALYRVGFEDAFRGENDGGIYSAGYGMITALGENRIALTGSQDILGTFFCTREFTLTEQGFVFADDGLWVTDRDLTDAEIWEFAVVAEQSFPVVFFDGETEREGELKAGERFHVVASDKVSVLYFAMQDGRTGRFAIEPDVEMGWGLLVNGMPEDEMLDNLFYAD